MNANLSCRPLHTFQHSTRQIGCTIQKASLFVFPHHGHATIQGKAGRMAGTISLIAWMIWGNESMFWAAFSSTIIILPLFISISSTIICHRSFVHFLSLIITLPSTVDGAKENEQRKLDTGGVRPQTRVHKLYQEFGPGTTNNDWRK